MKLTSDQTAAWLASRLEILGLSQEELATRAGIAAADVSRYKQHKQRPRIDQVEKLAAALGVDVVEVLIGLGAIDPKAETTPQIKGSKSRTAHWNQ